MGEYAEIEIWAEMHGTTTADLSPEEWAAAYDDIDAEARIAHGKPRCPICGSKKKTVSGVYRHAVAVHTRPKHADAIEAFRVDHELPSITPARRPKEGEA